MLKTHGVLHFSLPVTDLDRSRQFYEGVLGMKVVEQSARMVFLQTGEDFLILAKGSEPLRYDSPKSTPVHHAFKVKPEDFEPSIADLCKNGIEVFNIEDRTREFSGDRRRIFSIPTGTNWRSTLGRERSGTDFALDSQRAEKERGFVGAAIAAPTFYC